MLAILTMALAQAPCLPRTIADPLPSRDFANVVASSGDRLLISSWTPNSSAEYPEVRIYERNSMDGTWVLAQTIEMDQGLTGGSITAMALNGSSAIVRTRRISDSRVHFLQRDSGSGTWNLTDSFSSIGSSDGDESADDVAILGNVALAAHHPATQRVRVYTRSAPGMPWSNTNDILAPNAGDTDFGRSISFDGRLAVIGAPQDQNGRTYVFRLEASNRWTFLQELSPRGASIRAFGEQVEHIGDVLVVSAPQNSAQPFLPMNAGSVEVFRFVPSTQRWLFVQLLRANMPRSSQRFGSEVALGGGYVSVGANFESAPNEPGELHNYRLDLNTNLFRFERLITGNTGPFIGNGLGDSVEVTGPLLVAGIDGPGTVVVSPIGLINCDGDATQDSCEILLGQEFDTNRNGLPDPCEETGIRYCSPAMPNSTGVPARMAFFGVPRTALFAVDLAAEGLPPGAFGYFMASRTNQVTTNPGMWLGDLCLDGSPISRRVGGAQIAGGAGRADVRYNRALLPSPNTSSLIPILPGDTWYFQYWYRDTAMMPMANFSDAVEVTFTLF